MRSRILFFTLLLAVGAFALPLATHAAAIPNFDPIIPKATADCPAGWGMLITVINNIITVLLTLIIVFLAPIMIAYAGFLFVVNPVNAGGREQAKKILTNTIVGIIISLAAWMIVGAIMAALYKSPDGTWGTWETLMTGGGSADDCLDQQGSRASAPTIPAPEKPPVTVVPSTCKVSPLSSVLDTDPLAWRMENGQTVMWEKTDPRLQKCANKFVSKLIAGGERDAYITSAYRPQAYQTHLWEIHDKWCTKGLKSNADKACYQIKADVLYHVSKHELGACELVGQNSNHLAGNAVDIGRIKNPSNSFVISAAKESCLNWPHGLKDKVHYELMISCTCQ